MSPDVLTQLRSYAEQLDAQAVSYEEVAAPPTSPRRWVTERRRRRPMRAWAIAVATAVITILVIALPLLWLGGGAEEAPVVTEPVPEPTVAQTPTTEAPVVTEPVPEPSVATTVPQTPTTEAATVPGVVPSSWQRVGADVMQPVVGMFSVTHTGSQFVAVGFDPGEDLRQDGVIFASNDGVTWRRIAENDPALTTGTALIYSITGGGPGLVAVGTGCEDDAERCAVYPTVWTSVDGTAWTRSAADRAVFGESGEMSDIAVTEQGIVAVGSVQSMVGEDVLSIQPVVWLSADAVDWVRAWEGTAVEVSIADVSGGIFPGMRAVATDADGRVVIVGSATDSQGAVVAAVWLSEDGRSWERIDPDAAAFTGAAVAMFNVTAGPTGFIAVGTERGQQVAVWTSPDGRSWTRVNTAEQPFAPATSLSAVGAIDGGYIAAGPHGFVGTGETTAALWTSPDGSTWHRVEVLGPGYVMALQVADQTIAVAGGLPEANDYHAAVWVGPAHDPASPPPDPMPATGTTEAVEPAGPPGIG